MAPQAADQLISPNCVFDASLMPETCLESPSFANLMQDSIHQAKADMRLALRARRLASVRYWRSLVWWKDLVVTAPATPLESFLNRSSPGQTGSVDVMVTQTLVSEVGSEKCNDKPFIFILLRASKRRLFQTLSNPNLPHSLAKHRGVYRRSQTFAPGPSDYSLRTTHSLFSSSAILMPLDNNQSHTLPRSKGAPCSRCA